MSEAARLAFERDAKTREGGTYADVDLRSTRTAYGYMNPSWSADWLLWERAWNAGVAAAMGMEVIPTAGVRAVDEAQASGGSDAG